MLGLRLLLEHLGVRQPATRKPFFELRVALNLQCRQLWDGWSRVPPEPFRTSGIGGTCETDCLGGRTRMA